MQIRRSDSTRLEAFSDGVFAFAATLLVVSLEVPDSFDGLLPDLSRFGSFALGFAALVLLWTVHNAYFRRYSLQDNWKDRVERLSSVRNPLLRISTEARRGRHHRLRVRHR